MKALKIFILPKGMGFYTLFFELLSKSLSTISLIIQPHFSLKLNLKEKQQNVFEI